MTKMGIQGVYGRTALAATALCAAYFEARRRILSKAQADATRIGPRWLGSMTAAMLNKFSTLLGVEFCSEGGEGLSKLDPSRRYMIVWHPHGFIAWTAMFLVSKMAVEGHPHGQEWFAMVAPALFRIPIISEALMLVNARCVDKKVMTNLAGKGASVAVQPGGVREQMASRHDQEQAFFPKNLGFIRMALTYGQDLLPCYVFNENQLYRRVQGCDGLSQSIYKHTGFGLPICQGRFGIPGFLPPHPAKIHVRWGSPVHVGEAIANPTDEQVEEVFTRYVQSLRDIFDRHAHECLPPEVAARGLQIHRLDGKPVPSQISSGCSEERVGGPHGQQTLQGRHAASAAGFKDYSMTQVQPLAASRL